MRSHSLTFNHVSFPSHFSLLSLISSLRAGTTLSHAGLFSSTYQMPTQYFLNNFLNLHSLIITFQKSESAVLTEAMH